MSPGSRLKRLQNYLRASYIDLRLFLTGKNRDLPPIRLRYVGDGDFREVGEDLARLLIDRGGLRPDDRVLDIGCGVGRVALPLTRYLSAMGSYDGFDIVPAAIRWCERHISRRRRNFRFHVAGVRNEHYHRGGVRAEEFRFPFDDATFDFAFGTSLFTHLTTGEIARPPAEAGRVLRPGGTLLASFFLIDNEARQAIESGRAAVSFQPVGDAIWVLDPKDPAAAVALARPSLDQFLRQAGLHTVTVHRGRWAHQEGLSYQDVVIARRVSEPLLVGPA